MLFEYYILIINIFIEKKLLSQVEKKPQALNLIRK